MLRTIDMHMNVGSKSTTIYGIVHHKKLSDLVNQSIKNGSRVPAGWHP